MDIQTIDRAGLERAQKDLLPKIDSGLRGGDEQREFIGLVRDDAGAFCARLRSWGLTGGETPPVMDEALSEREFVDPSWSTECAIAATWGALPVRLAARPETWVRVHVELIEQGKIESSYLLQALGVSPVIRRSRRLCGATIQRKSTIACAQCCAASVASFPIGLTGPHSSIARLRKLGGDIATRRRRTGCSTATRRKTFRALYANDSDGRGLLRT